MAKSVKASPKKAARRTAPKKVTKQPAKKAVAKKAPVKKTAARKAAKATPKKAARKTAQRKSPAAAKTAGKTFLIIYHAPIDATDQTANMSPEEQAAGMALWQAWAERVGGNLLDLGAPLINGKRLASQAEPMPSTRDVAGYSLLSADDWDEVISLLEGHPHISGWHPEATIEVHETMVIPGM